MLLNNLAIRRRVSPYHDIADNDQENPPSSLELVSTTTTTTTNSSFPSKQEQQHPPAQHEVTTANSLWYYRSLAFFIVSIVLVNIIRIGISTLDIGKRAPPLRIEQLHLNSRHPTSSSSTSDNPDADIWHVAEPSSAKKRIKDKSSSSSVVQAQKHRNKTTTASKSSSSSSATDNTMASNPLTSSTKILPGAALGLGDVAAEALLPQQQQQVTTTTIIKQKHVLVVGGVGFIGFHTSIYFKRLGHSVVVVDSMQSQYYTNHLQHIRSQILQKEYGITVYTANMCEITPSHPYSNLLQQHRITHVIYLAAQPFSLNSSINTTATTLTNRTTSSKPNGIIYNTSITTKTTKLFEYPPNNIDCFATVLDWLKNQDIHLVYAVNHHWNEIKGIHPQAELLQSPQRLLTKAYYNLYGLASIGIEFPTTYGPFGRPDHYYYKLVATTLSSTPSNPATIQLPTIPVAGDIFNSSKQTLHTSLIFIDDVVRGIVSTTDFVFDAAQMLTLGKSCSFSWETVGLPAIITAANLKNGSYLPPFVEDIDVSQDEIHFPPDLFKVDEVTNNMCHELSNDRISLETGMSTFVNWYEMEQGERFVMNDMDKNATYNNSTTTLYISTENNDEDSTSSKSFGNKHLNHICFVTSLFIENAQGDGYDYDGKGSNKSPANDKKSLAKYKTYHKDKLASTSHLDHSLPYLFFSFTNVREEKPPNDGWERIVIENLPFQRFVTGSLWPKYMGWKHAKLSTCRIICYSDASLRPKDLLLADWMNLAQVAIEYGIVHQPHPSPHVTLLEELGERNGTTPFTSTKSKSWFLQQTDFNNEAPRYKTNAFVYDPSNEDVRELMTTVWAHYSQENDVSWRDQPLYRYVLSKLRIQPAQFPSNDESKEMGEIKDFWEDDWEEDLHFMGSN